MDSEGSRKRKMKMGNEEKVKEEEEEEESEEEKMNKFFALIRSTRDSRQRLIHGSGGSAGKKAEESGKQAAGGAWNPTFLLEDFMKDPAPAAPVSQPSKSGSKEEEEDKGIDLNLSL